MSNVLKYIIYVLCIAGIISIHVLLNDISAGNPSGVGLGDCILMCIGCYTIMRKVKKIIFDI